MLRFNKNFYDSNYINYFYDLSYVNKFQMNSYYIPIGTKYHTHHAYILENLSRKFPSMQWSIMAKNNTQFLCKGVRV